MECPGEMLGHNERLAAIGHRLQVRRAPTHRKYTAMACGPSASSRDPFRHFCWKPFVIAVLKRHILAFGDSNLTVTGSARSTILLVTYGDYSLISNLREKIDRSVIRAMGDNDQSEIGIGLTQHTVNGSDDRLFAFKCRYNERNLRHRAHYDSATDRR